MKLSAVDISMPSTDEELAFLPLTHLAKLVERRDIKPTELAELYIARLKHYAPTLHCVVSLTEDIARRQAKRADEEIVAGTYRGPLHGIPWGAKDLLSVKGTKTTWGDTPYKDQIIDTDATVYTRLTRAGAVLVAKLSMGALASGDRWFGGRTRNPWNTEQGVERLLGGPRLGHGRGARGFFDRHRDARFDHLAVDEKRCDGSAAELRSREPIRRDGTFGKHGQDRTHVPLGRGLCARFRCHPGSRRKRQHAVRSSPSTGMPEVTSASYA